MFRLPLFFALQHGIAYPDKMLPTERAVQAVGALLGIQQG